MTLAGRPGGAYLGRDRQQEGGMSNTDALEERLAHMERSVDDLSDTVARQDREIEQLSRRLSLLIAREAQRDSDAPGALVMGDERPPHY
jgi:SlyX protein